jgi:hypothetical protein
MARSWLLLNSNGTTDMSKGDMDIRFSDGSIAETRSPVDTLNQRICKASIEPQGSNRFAPSWGSVFSLLIGSKNLADETMRLVARSLITMIAGMIAAQMEAQRRIALDPAELIDSIAGVSVESEGTKLTPHVRLYTQAKTMDEITLPEVNLGA